MLSKEIEINSIKENKTINYDYFHWGPFLYKTTLTTDELNQIEKICSKDSEDYRSNLAGLIMHEHKVDVKKLFPIIAPYLQSYVKAYMDYRGEPLGKKIELMTAWVNYMTKFESNPLHTHDEDLSFIIFIKIPKELKQEAKETISIHKPGSVSFVHTLDNKDEIIGSHTFFPKVGDFFIFPACLHHYVNSFKCEGERISVSGNLKKIDG